MSNSKSISGVRTFAVEVKKDRTIMLKDTDDLLRRFGQIEIRQISNKKVSQFTVRAVADEIWTLIDGNAELILIDQRPKSPTENNAVRLYLDSEETQGVLIPFGVAYSFSTNDSAQLMRITTHADGMHENDRQASDEEMKFFYSDL